MIGEDKVPGLMHEAINDLKSYAQGGLVAAQYGAVPGIPAYAASGHELQFCFISRDGQVRPWCSSCLEVAFPFRHVFMIRILDLLGVLADVTPFTLGLPGAFCWACSQPGYSQRASGGCLLHNPDIPADGLDGVHHSAARDATAPLGEANQGTGVHLSHAKWG